MGIKCALIEFTKCRCDITHSSTMLVEDKEIRKIRYVVVLWGVMSRWIGRKRKATKPIFRPFLVWYICYGVTNTVSLDQDCFPSSHGEAVRKARGVSIL